MTNPLVSIIVPCYNQAQYLPETLDSVLAQTYSNWECVIVNDGSPDNTDEIAKQYCEKDKRFQYLYKENGGLSSARNAGIRASTGEFILPLDSDDLIGTLYLEKALERFTDYPETKLVYCKAELFGQESGEWKLPEYDYMSLLFENMIFCTSMYKRKDYDLTIGYNEKMVHGFEDWDFWLSLIKESDIVFQIPEIYFYYRIRNRSMLRSITEESHFSIREDFLNNHFENFEKHIPMLIWKNPYITQQNDTIQFLNSELLKTRNSKAYRLGKFLLKPFSYIRNKIR